MDKAQFALSAKMGTFQQKIFVLDKQSTTTAQI